MDAEHIEVFMNRNPDKDEGVKAQTTGIVESVDTRIKQLRKKKDTRAQKKRSWSRWIMIIGHPKKTESKTVTFGDPIADL